MKLLIIAFLLFLSLRPAAAQTNATEQNSKCKTRFVVFQMNPHIPGGIAPGMSKEQANWYDKNKGRYPNACLGGDAWDFVVVWSSRFSSQGTPEPTVNFGAIYGSLGASATQASGYGVSEPFESEYVYLTIFRGDDVRRTLQDKSFQPVPVFFTQHDSWFTYRASHRKSMEDAMKFLSAPANQRGRIE